MLWKDLISFLIGILPRSGYSFRVPDEDNRVHRCLSKRIYRQFPQDSRRLRERPASLCDDWSTSGGEDDEMSDEDMSEIEEVAFNLVSFAQSGFPQATSDSCKTSLCV